MTILMYHKVDLTSPTIWWVTVDQFYRQMLELQHRKVVYLDEYDPQNPSHVVVTFDGIYKNVLTYAAPVLRHFGYPFELFASSSFIGKDNSFDTVEPLTEFATVEDLQALVACNGRLQWHTRSHCDLTLDENEPLFMNELTIPEEVRSIDSKGWNWFAYPYGNFDDRILALVKQRFRGAVSCHQGNDMDVHILNRITVTNETRFNRATIAVVITSYNYGSFLVEAVESVLRQTRLPDEILISDDCSTDNTLEIAQFYQSQYPDLIRVNHNAENLGIVQHFNKAVQLTNSEYVSILGADNRYRSDYVEKTAAILDLNDNVAIAYTDFALFGKRAELVYSGFPEEKRGKIKADSFFIINFPEFTEASKRELLERGTNFIHGSSMFRRSAFTKVGGYEKHPNFPEDYALFRRIILAGWNAKRSPHELLEYRQHSKEQANIQLGNYTELQFYKEQLKAKSSEAQELKLKIQGLTWDVEHLQGDLTEVQTQLTQKFEEYQQAHVQLREMQSQLQQTQIQLAQANLKVERKEARIKERDQTVKARNQELKDLRERIGAMETSKFWKLRASWFRLKKFMKLLPDE
jgi:glycosyltransferase involved in cell wall biosynthesis